MRPWKSRPKFHENERIILRADPTEGFPEERGFILSVEEDYDQMYMVSVDRRYRTRGDDGIREVSEDQMESE